MLILVDSRKRVLSEGQVSKTKDHHGTFTSSILNVGEDDPMCGPALHGTQVRAIPQPVTEFDVR